jgi:hypothetical protein
MIGSRSWIIRSMVVWIVCSLPFAAFAARHYKNKPPTVDIVSPVNGASFSAPAMISFEANATDADTGDYVASVEFYSGTMLIATATSGANSTWTANWSNVPAGSYSLTAKATDSKGATATSSAVNITVVAVQPPNQLPLVVQTSPVACQTFDITAEVFLEASAEDPDGAITKVEYFQGSTLIGTSTTYPYRVLWTGMLEGDQLLTARATDSQGDQTTSTPISVTVVQTNNIHPTISLTTPTEGSSHPFDAPIALSADAADSDGSVYIVEYYDGETKIGYSYSPPYSVNWNGAKMGAHVLTAKAKDDKGAVAISAPVTITVARNVAPTISITSPADNSTFVAPATIPVEVDAADSDGVIVQVNYFVNGYYKGTRTTPPFQYTLYNQAAGTYQIKAVAYDDSNATTGSGVINVTVNPNTPPNVSLTSPVSGATYYEPASVTLSANADDIDGSIAKVEFYNNGGARIATVTSSPYTYTWNNVAAGTYSLTAKATDNGGATATSSAATITVNPNNWPTVSLTQPSAGSTYTAPTSIALSADAADSDGTVAKVDFYADTTFIGTSTVSPYNITWDNVPAGSYALTAKATDNHGAVTTSTAISITVNPNAPPVISLISPIDGAYFLAPADIVLSASASDVDGTVLSVDFYNGSTLINSDSTAPYSIDWSGVQEGSYTITAMATDDTGNITTSSPVYITVTSTPLTITSPVDGATVTSQTVLVSGMAQGVPENSGVTVNGVAAPIDSNGAFFANDVPLNEGENTLTATLTTPSGAVYEQSILVISTPDANAATIVPDTLQGFAPLTVNFTLELPEGNTLQILDVDFDADGTVESTYTDPNLSTLSLTYSATGTYHLLLRVTDSQNTVTEKNFVISVITPAMLDSTLKSVYNTMVGDLGAGDVEGALTAFSGNTREKYRAVFNEIGTNLPAVAEALGILNSGQLTTNWAEYLLTRDEADGPHAYLVYFMRCEDGVWRIDGM